MSDIFPACTIEVKMKKFSILMTCHLILMVMILIFSILSTIMLLSGFGFSSELNPESEKLQVILRGSMNIINVLAIVSGMVYLWKGYGKDVAAYYRTMMLLQVVSSAIMIVLISIYFSTGALSIISLVVMSVKVLLLLVLTFMNNWGKKNSMALFCIILIVDIIGIVCMFIGVSRADLVYRISDAASRLILDGTIGLAIKGKYDDKERRGTD